MFEPKTIRGRLAPVVLFSIVITLPAAAQTPQRVFDTLYGPELRKVQATRGGEDDLELARKLDQAAQGPAIDTQLCLLMLEHAYELAADHVEGIDLAVNIAQKLAKRQPDKAGEIESELLGLYERHYYRASGEQRAQIAAELVNRYVAIGDAQLAKGDTQEAVRYYRMARKYGRAAGDEYQALIKHRQDKAQHLGRLARQIENYQERIDRDPFDTAATEALIDLYVIELGEPAKLGKALQTIMDPKIKDQIAKLAKPIEKLQTQQLMAMGDWYRAKAAAASAHAGEGALGKAMAYYQAYLDRQTDDNLMRSKAQISIRQIEEQLGGGTEGWIDALKKIDASKDLHGKWEKSSNRWIGRGEPALMRVPVELGKAYLVKSKVARVKDVQPLGMALPVGSARVLALFDFTGNLTGLSTIDGKFIHETGVAVKTPPLATGKFYDLKASVTCSAASATVKLFIENTLVFKWTGKPERLAISNKFKAPGDDANAVIVGRSVAVEEVFVKAE